MPTPQPNKHQPPVPAELDLKASIVPQSDGTISLVLHQIRPELFEAVLKRLGDEATIQQFVSGMYAELERQEQSKAN